MEPPGPAGAWPIGPAKGRTRWLHAGYLRGQASRVLDEAVVERIAGAADGADRVDGTPTVERLAQTSDVDIDRAFVDIHIAAPDAIQELLAGENASRILHQEFKQAEFRRPQ